VIHLVGIGIYVFLLIIFIVALMFLRIRFEVEYKRQGPDDNIKVEMATLQGLIRYQTNIPVVELDRYFLEPVLKIETGIQGAVSHPVEDKGLIVKIPVLTAVLSKLPLYLQQGLEYLQRYRKVLRKLLKTIRFHHLTWITQVGFGDPADTGVATGILWGMKGYLYSVFRSHAGTVVNAPRLSVIPCFDCTCLRLDFHCIFDVRIGHIIIAGLNFVKLALKP